MFTVSIWPGAKRKREKKMLADARASEPPAPSKTSPPMCGRPNQSPSFSLMGVFTLPTPLPPPFPSRLKIETWNSKHPRVTLSPRYGLVLLRLLQESVSLPVSVKNTTTAKRKNHSRKSRGREPQGSWGEGGQDC